MKIPDVGFTMIQKIKETMTDLKYKTQVHVVYKHSYEIHWLHRNELMKLYFQCQLNKLVVIKLNFLCQPNKLVVPILVLDEKTLV